MMRCWPLAALVGLVACTGGEAQPQANDGAQRIDCAQGEGAEFGPDCLVEKVAGEEGPEFVVRHPNGAFRRFRIGQDRRSMIALDGADETVNTITGDPPIMEVAVDRDRYRFPATLDAQP